MKFLYLLALLPMLAFGDDDCKGDPHDCQGPPGVDGKDGVVPTEWIEETRSFEYRYGRWAAASEALQIHLPQEQQSRITFGIGRTHGNTALGVGYAYKTTREDNLAFTFGLGKSGSEEVAKASFGFEFGGSTKKPELTVTKYKAQLECAYVGGQLSLTNECVLDE